MSQEKIESRRAFMKKLGKVIGTTAVAAAFMASTSKDAKAKPTEDSPATGCFNDTCMSSCHAYCRSSSSGF